jgi:hypothetical protein
MSPSHPGEFEYLKIHVDDSPVVDLVAHFSECFAFIDGAIASDGEPAAPPACEAALAPLVAALGLGTSPTRSPPPRPVCMQAWCLCTALPACRAPPAWSSAT